MVTQQTDFVFLKEAERIGAKICRNALWSGEQCYWEDDFIEVVRDRRVIVRRPIGLDLYFGGSGIALFLAALYSLAPNRAYSMAAQGSAKLTIAHIEDVGPRFPIGFYIGYLGIAVALIQLGEVFCNEQFITSGLQLVRRIRDSEIGPPGLDVISGAAGAIPALLLIYQKYSDESVLDLAVNYGEHLIDCATKGYEDLSSPGAENTRSQARPQTGFSHGDAGVGWALLELASATGVTRYSIAAEEIFRSQRTLFDQLRKRLRDPETPPAKDLHHSFSWCQGTVGLAVSRLRAYDLTQEQIYKDDAETAFRTTFESLRYSQTVSDYSLCHGIAGAGDSFIYAGEVLHDVSYRRAAIEKGLQGIEHLERNGLTWPCGSPAGSESLSLMQGIAGIGYFYLRLYDPERTPPLTILLPNKTLHAKA
jgi:class II lanthipeptide synthase